MNRQLNKFKAKKFRSKFCVHALTARLNAHDERVLKV